MENILIQLSSNENPSGCSPLVKQVILESEHLYSRYPHHNILRLSENLANQLNIDKHQVLPTNGSAEALELIIRAFSTRDCEIILPQYAFYFQKIMCHHFSLNIKEIATNDGHQNLIKILNSINKKTRFILLTNPSNPMGTFIKFCDLQKFMAQVSNNIIVIIDEAYYEYMIEEEYQTAISLINKYDNLMITRTFSKAYGLAGLRVGYCIGNQDLIQLISKIKNPFSMNNPAIIAAEAALKDTHFVHKTQMLNREGLNQLAVGLNSMNIKYLNKTANFITIDLEQNANLFAEKLLKQSIIVKTLHEYNLPNHLRISVGLVDENNAFLEALEKICLTGETYVATS